MDSVTLVGPDSHHLLAVEGWLELGNPMEALVELDRVSPVFRHHPHVLSARWQVAAALRDWATAFSAANLMMVHTPLDPAGWIQRSYAIRRAPSGGLQQAWDALLPAFDKFPAISIIPYNLACYSAQLGKLDDAWDWLHRAMEAAEDVAEIKGMAMKDEDLRALWSRVKTL